VIETPKGGERQAACRRPDPSLGEEVSLKREAVAGGGMPLEGTKAQGRNGPTPALASERQRTSAEGKARKTSEVLSAQARQARLSQRQAGWSGRKARIVPRKGKPSKGESQERYRSETRSKRLREEQSVKEVRNLEDAAYPGPVTPGKVASRFRKR
jgi:hypothetical protein